MAPTRQFARRDDERSQTAAPTVRVVLDRLLSGNESAQRIALTPLRDGVYEVQGLGLRIRVIVVHQLPLNEHNAMLHLFSAREELLRYGREHYRPHSPETSTLLYELFTEYSEELTMSDKLKEFVRQSLDKIFAGLPAEERLKGLPVEERLKGLSAEEIARALSPEIREELAQKLKANGHSSTPQ